MNTKNILITGSTSALAKSLIKVAARKKKYRVLAVSRSEQTLSQQSVGGFLDFKSLSGIDFTNEANLKVLDECLKEFFAEKFDVVHFSGDFWRHKPLVCTEFSELQSMISSHFVTLCGVAQITTPMMIKFGGGRLVAFSCNSVGYNYPDMSPFTSAKAAVESFVRCYANEYAPYGISATAIALPTMKTEEIIMEKPNGDHENFIEPDALSTFVLDHVLTSPKMETGNIVRLVGPSPTFYGMGYFERNPRKEEHEHAMHTPSSIDTAHLASGNSLRHA